MVHYEFLNRPFQHNATLWDEHKSLLHKLTSQEYVKAAGPATLATLPLSVVLPRTRARAQLLSKLCS